MAFILLSSTGSPGRIGDVQIDVIESVSAPRTYTRTDVSLETGAPVALHRRRVPFVLSVVIMVSDVNPVVIGPWEFNHAKKVEDRLEALQSSGEEVTFFDGTRFYRPPGNQRGWIIDDIAPNVIADEQGLRLRTYRATITLGEMPRFTTAFTTLDPNVDAASQDGVDGVVDKGQQSTEAIPAEQAGGVALS